MWFNDGNKWLAVVVQAEVATGIKVTIASPFKTHTLREVCAALSNDLLLPKL